MNVKKSSTITRVMMGVIGIVIIILIGSAIFIALKHPQKPEPVIVTPQPTPQPSPLYKIIGTSVQGRNIESYTYGSSTNPTRLLFVGGMHGGYEWNSVLLAYQFMDYLKANPDALPANISVTVIPTLNPDGVYEVTGKVGRFTAADVSTNQKVLATGRFNAHAVDLNRNFACNWQATSTWQSKIVSAGTSAFSEPETLALKNFIVESKPSAAIFWHSQSNAVYASECNNGILPKTIDSMNAYSKAAGYPAVKSFDAYPITGDAEGWLASIGIPAITVELKTHEDIEWTRNLAGIKALLNYYSLIK